ncbi:MAG: class I SAM-dependent methyltransferase [Acidobacteria bacterium]|nr:class I SAM-dependent methyltransferase [Acidobacteriota bacterium]
MRTTGDRLHSTPIDDEGNLLDRISSSARFRYYYSAFRAREKARVEEAIATIIPRGRVLNVGCGRNGTERALFPRPHYQIVGVDVDAESLRIPAEKRLYDALYEARIASLPFADESFDLVYLRLVLHHLVYPRNLVADGVNHGRAGVRNHAAPASTRRVPAARAATGTLEKLECIGPYALTSPSRRSGSDSSPTSAARRRGRRQSHRSVRPRRSP